MNMYTICLVEDEKSLSDLIKMYLEKEGYEVIQFFNGKDAMEYVGEKCHLWILDIMLNDDISGYDLIKVIREKDQNIPVIFTSARDQDIDKIIGLEMGSDDYLAKPFSSEPKAYSKNHIEKLIKLQEYYVNGIDIFNLYINGCKNQSSATVKKEDLDFSIFEKNAKESSNMPILQGENSILRKTLYNIAHGYSFI